jgi:hypothetical protein
MGTPREVIDFTSKIDAVLATTACNRHGAELDQACFTIPSGLFSQFFAGICNQRAKKHGMVGKIDPRSLSNKRPKK